jgi:4-amino-4-deoxy-L-arabinose transferase-like glycosyltransferase
MKATHTTERAPAIAREVGRASALGLSLLLPLLIGLTTLLPRAFGLADFFTTDEAYHWVTRSERFAAAVGAGRWADTIITGHPGVTLMWLGALGLRLEQLAVGLGWAAPPDALGHLAWLRLGPALAHAIAVPAGYLLLRRLVRPAAALVTALLWATSPFLVAHGRLLHLDALLTDLCTLTLLAALVACRAARPRPWLILTGALCGLALLTKGPALILLPFLGLALFALGNREGAAPGGWLRWTARGLAWSIPRYLLILAVAALVVITLWPALWVEPGRAVADYVGEIVGNGGRPNGDGQFFLGRSVADPGPLFYPLAGLFRLTPVELLGLLIVGFGFWLGRARRAVAPEQRPRATAAHLEPIHNPQSEIQNLLALALFALWWLLVMTAGPKKFDRYILPMWPALLTLSAAGLVWATERLGRRRPFRPLHAAIAMLLLQGGLLAWYHPYYLSYYSPLLGGGPVAQRAFLIGWGEGMERAGAWLRGRPDIGEGQILSALPPTLQPFVPVPVREVRAIDSVPANYAVVYLESLQRGDAPELYARIQETLPLHTVRIHGIDYAQIHQLAKPFAEPVGAEFGGAVRLRGFTAAVEGRRIVLTPSWDVRAPIGADLMLFVHVFDAAGERVAAIVVPPGGASVPPTSQWLPGQQVAVPLPIDLPPEAGAGAFTLTLGLYDPATDARLPLTAGPAADPIAAGPDAALLGTVAVPTP